MERHEWLALGRALRALRTALDLPQKEVVRRSGEQMDERTLRAYESGALRPSRDRLLRLLTKSFELKNPAEINRSLQTAGYAVLTDSEILQTGLGPPAIKSDAFRSLVSAGPPIDYRIETSTLIALDDEGREVWRHKFPERLARAAYEGETAIRRCAFADIDGDGRIETLFAYVPLDFASVGTVLLCFADDGAVKWQFVPGKAIKDTRQEYLPPYFISNVKVIPVEKSCTRILVSSNHYLHNPNQIAMLDPSGELVSEYWHSGHLYAVAHTDLNNDGIEEILLAGVNNGYRLATLVIFDSRYVSGASTQPGRQIFGFPPGTEKAVVLFPRTCLSKSAPYNRTMELRITRERRIVLAVCEGVSEQRNPGVMIYELDFALNIINCRPDSHLYEAHRALELQGLLDHPWTEEENDRLRNEVVIKGQV
ncbi:MAG: helix-turn-helix transcriptional regulator [Bryobacteraceae bacterium]|jgi:transcriptional regulator with XRE-family HTH domain